MVVRRRELVDPLHTRLSDQDVGDDGAEVCVPDGSARCEG